MTRKETGNNTNTARDGVTNKATVATTIDARCGARIGAEVTVAATPDTSRLPVVGDTEGDRLTGILLPACCLVRLRVTSIGIREDLNTESAFGTRSWRR